MSGRRVKAQRRAPGVTVQERRAARHPSEVCVLCGNSPIKHDVTAEFPCPHGSTRLVSYFLCEGCASDEAVTERVKALFIAEGLLQGDGVFRDPVTA